MTKEPKKSIRNNIERKVTIQLRESRLRNHIKNKRNKTIVVDFYQIKRIIDRKKIFKRNDKKKMNQNQ